MSFYANAVTSITVKDKTGSTIGVLAGKVTLRGGDGLQVETDEDTITLNAGTAYTEPNARYRRKYKVVVDGGTFIDDDGTVMTFSGMPYYLASISGSKGNSVQDFDFLSNVCGQVGIFDPGLAPPPGDIVVSMRNVAGELELLDICQACIDCEDYQQIIDLMARIEEFQDWDVTRNLNDETEGGELALFNQYQASVHYWNYLVHGTCIPLTVINSTNQYFAINTGYHVKDCADFATVVQTITLDLAWCADVGDIAISFTNVTKRPDSLSNPSKTVTVVSPTEHTAEIEYPSLGYDEYIFFQLAIRATEPLCSLDVTSEWCNTHLGGPCVTRTRLGVL